MRERVAKRADQFSNKDLLDYVNVITTVAEKAAKQIGLVEDITLIQINTQNNIQVNDGTDLNKESRQRVMEAVSAALSSMGLTLDNLGSLQKIDDSQLTPLIEEIEDDSKNQPDSFVQTIKEPINSVEETSVEPAEIQVQFEIEEENF